MVEFADLIGKTLSLVERRDGADGDEIRFVTDQGEVYTQYHPQDCCESVDVESIVGDMADLIGSPVLRAEEVTHEGETPDGAAAPECSESYTWTFYKLATIKGGADIRWFGSSNGYYSESVYFRKD